MLSAVFIAISFTACTDENKAENKAENTTENTTATEANESKVISKQDDFYTAVNSEWLNSVEDDEEMSHTSNATDCQDDIIRFYEDYFTQLPNDDLPDDEKKLLVLYEQFTEGQLESSLEIAGDYIESISKAETLKDMEQLFVDERLSLYNGLFNFELTNTRESYLLSLSPMSIVGTDITKQISVLDDDSKSDYTKYIKDLLIKSEIFDESTAEDIAQRAVDLEVSILQIFDMRNSEGTTNMYSLNSDFIFNVDFANLLTSFGYDENCQYVVCRDEYVTLLNDELLTEENVENLKAYLTASVVCRIVGMAENTSEDNYQFYSIANYYMSDTLVSAYLNRNITDEDIDNVSKMVDEIVAVYKAKIDDITYLSDDAKDKAMRKIENINPLIARPKTLISYANADVSSSNSYVTNCENCLINKRSEQNRYLSTEYSNDKMIFDTMMVNAYYFVGSNSIIINAGIMQEPYYSREKSFEENLGGIGTIVAHEISHSLDITGSEYDEYGNYKSWWSTDDRKAFIDNAIKLKDFIQAQGEKDGLTLNATQTKSEDIADLTAIQCCVEVLNKMDNPDYEKFFTDYAILWREKCTDEIQQQRIDYDTHSLSKYRVNTPLQQVDEFYTTFNIKEGDGMYVPEAERISVW